MWEIWTKSEKPVRSGVIVVNRLDKTRKPTNINDTESHLQ